MKPSASLRIRPGDQVTAHSTAPAVCPVTLDPRQQNG